MSLHYHCLICGITSNKANLQSNVSALYCAGLLAVRTDAVCARQLPVDRRLHHEAALLEHRVLRSGVLDLLSPPVLLHLPVLPHPRGHSQPPAQWAPRAFRNVQTCNIFVTGVSAHSVCIGRPANGRHMSSPLLCIRNRRQAWHQQDCTECVCVCLAVPAPRSDRRDAWGKRRCSPCLQVGNVTEDHRVWGRAEDMRMPRPSFSVDLDHPGAPWVDADYRKLPLVPASTHLRSLLS